MIITYSIISSNIYIVKGKDEITALFRRNLRAKISEPADLPRRFVSCPRQSRGWALCFATAFSYFLFAAEAIGVLILGLIVGLVLNAIVPSPRSLQRS